ncbi:hypothetical protein L6260_00620 [Candidatus Parcubacteria bacterium]|nr:hypothetical protein [Candidatus Parcubacteria bacterium]
MDHLIIEELQAFFFRAMLQGWITGKKAKPIEGLPGYKGFRHQEDAGGYKLLLVDAWCSGMDDYSSGFTTIYTSPKDTDDGKPIWTPVWTMNYMGHYDEGEIIVVMDALRQAYRTRQFIGGRGLNSVRCGNLRYSNRTGRTACFESFDGVEHVEGSKRTPGFHEYSGGVLFDHKKK